MNKVKRILHVVGAMNRGGTETLLMTIYRHLNKDEIQFDFISYDEDEAHYDKEIKHLGGRIFKLTKTNSVKQLYDIMKKYGPYEVVHAHTLFHSGIASLAARLAGIKIRISHAHTTMDLSGTFSRRMYIRCMRMFINLFSTHLLACSRSAGAFLFGDKALEKSNYLYFPNVIEYKKFLHVPLRDIVNFKRTEGIENQLVIGHIGTFNKAKNHAFLIDVVENIARDHSTKLVLVGDGELRAGIEVEVEERKLKNEVSFLGIREDIATILHSLDVFVFPSNYEGLGLVLLESQASGIPCVVSEAIQPEADLGLGLITKMSLEAGARAWANKITQLKNEKELLKTDIIAQFEANGYVIREAIAILLRLYHVNRGDISEADINRVI